MNQTVVARPTVLCVGEVLLDAIEMYDEHGRSIGLPRLLAGGAPANTAMALRKLGVMSAFVGCIGKDAVGDDLLGLLRAAEVDVRGVQRTRDVPTRIVRVASDARGERTFLDFGGASAEAFADARLRAQSLRPQLLAGVGCIVVGSLSQAYPQSREAITRILNDARERAIPVVLDVNRRPMFWPAAKVPRERELTDALIRLATYLKASDEEARWLFGTRRSEEIAAIVPWLRGVVVTNGPHEMNYHIHGVGGTLLPPTMTAVDTTGAGDAFTAGWIARLLSSDEAIDARGINEMMRYASIVGALATTGIGAWSALPTHHDVEAFLATHAF